MGDSFFQALKWSISAALIIGGIAALAAAERSGSLQPFILAVISFGGAYVMSGSWRKFPGKAVIVSLVFALLTGVAARYLPGYAYVYLNTSLATNVFFLWALLVFIVGVPFMTIVFYIFGD